MTATATPMTTGTGILGLLGAAGSSRAQDAADGSGAFATQLLSVQADAAAPTLAAPADAIPLPASLVTPSAAPKLPATSLAATASPTPSPSSPTPASPLSANPVMGNGPTANSVVTPTEPASTAAGIPGVRTPPATPATPASADSPSATDDASSAAQAVPAATNGSTDTATPATSVPVRHIAGRHAAGQDAAAAPVPMLTAAAPPITAAAASGMPPVPTTGALDSDADDLPDDVSVSASSLTSAGDHAMRPIGARSHVAAVSAALVPSFGTDAAVADVATVAPTQTSQGKSGRSDSNPDLPDAAVTIAPIDGAAPATPVAAPVPVAVTPAPAPAPAPLQDQLVRPILTLRAAAAGTHVLTIKVAPEAIGPVTVRAHISAGSLRVEIIAPNDDGSSALRAILPDLKRDLAQGGMNAALTLHQHAGADFSAATSTSSQDSRGETGGAATDLGGRPTREPVTTPTEREAPVPTPAPIARSFSGDTSLDVLA